MPQTDVYGGSGWYELALRAAAEAAARAMQEWQMMGWKTQPAVKPTREQALTAIWQKTAAAQKEKGNPVEAATKWLSKQGITDDPIQWAINQGYISGETPETKTPTMERQQWEESVRQWQAQFGEQTQQSREGLGLQYMQLLSSLKGPGDWLNYWNVARAGQNSELPMWATQLAQGRGLPAFQGTPGAVDPANVWLRPNQPGMGSPTEGYQYGTRANQFPLYYDPTTGQWTAQAASQGPVPNSGAMPGGQQTPYVPGYNGQQSPWTPWQIPNASYQGGQQPGMPYGRGYVPGPQINQNLPTPIQNGQPPVMPPTQPGTMTQYQQPAPGRGYVAPNMTAMDLGTGAQTNTGQDQQQALAQQMMQYYMQMMMQGGNPQTINKLPNNDAGVLNMPNMPSTWRPAMPTYQPHRITPGMWNNLMPSEQEGFMGMIEGNGQWGPDFMKMMQAAWPKANVRGRTFWS